MDMPRTLVSMLKSARVKRIPKGQIILYEGDVSPDVFIIKSGTIKVYDIDESGNEKVLHIVKSPAVLPLVFFSGTTEGTHWFYTALTDCDVYVLPEKELRQKMRDDTVLTLYLTTWFSREAHELLVRLSSLGKTVARDKVIAALKFLAVRHANKRWSGWHRVAFPVSQQLIADMVGVTRESAAVVMKELQDEKVIRNPRLTTLEVNLKKLTK